MACSERSPTSVIITTPTGGGEIPKSGNSPTMFPYNRQNLPPKLSHSTRLLSADEVYNLFNNPKKGRIPGGSHLDPQAGTGSGGPGRHHRIASADGGEASLGNASMPDDCSDVTSDGTLSRCTSTDRISLADGQVEDRFRVDRRKLEAMILGCPPDPCDFEIMRLPIGSDGRILSADDFFARVMENTNTDIRYPRLLKVGARNRKDPHVRIVGTPENVSIAGQMVRSQLEPHNKITMKMDVSWTHHSHIIGKAGNTIQPVVRRTGVSIHFPDGNKNNDTKKSNQVSINSRGDDLGGLEIARSSIRALTPLIFTFSLNANAKFITLSEPAQLVTHIQNIYNVQVELSVTSDACPLLLGSVRGSESDVCRVKEATMCLLRNICGTLATQMPVRMKIEVSPQHHSFILGRNNDNLKRIMQTTATHISFPSSNDPSVPPLLKSTITISGSINNVYTARQNIVGALPLTLMFEIPGANDLNMEDLSHLMASSNLSIIPKSIRHDNRRPIVIRGAERDAERIYEAWKIVTRSEHKIPSVTIPPTYFIADLNNSPSIPPAFLSSSSSRPTSLSNPMSPHILPPLTPNYPPPPTPTFPPSTPLLPPTPTWGPPGGSAPPVISSGGTNFPFPPHGVIYEAPQPQRNNYVSQALHQGTSGGGSNSPSIMSSPMFFSDNFTSNPPNYSSNAPNFNNNTISYTSNYNSSINPSVSSYGGNYNLFNSNYLNTNSNNLLNNRSGDYTRDNAFTRTPKQEESPASVGGKPTNTPPVGSAMSPIVTSVNSSPSLHGIAKSPLAASVLSPCDSSPRLGSNGPIGGGDSSPEERVVLGHIHSPPLVAQRREEASAAGGASPQLSLPASRRSKEEEISGDVRNLSSLLCELTSQAQTSQNWKKAPGAERHEKDLETAINKLAFSDYEAKQILASKAMKKPVGGTVRVPTSNWSGYGFSKSSPSYQMKQQFLQAGLIKNNLRNGGGALGTFQKDEASTRTNAVWGDDGRGWNDNKWSDGSGRGPHPGLSNSLSSNQASNSSLGDSSDALGNSLSSNSSSGTVPSAKLPHNALPRSVFNNQRLSASSIAECVSTKNFLPDNKESPLSTLDLSSILTELHMSQYIDQFLAQEVDLQMFLNLNDNDLKELGISAFGHRKKLLIAIKKMTTNLSSLASSEFSLGKV